MFVLVMLRLRDRHVALSFYRMQFRLFGSLKTKNRTIRNKYILLIISTALYGINFNF